MRALFANNKVRFARAEQPCSICNMASTQRQKIYTKNYLTLNKHKRQKKHKTEQVANTNKAENEQYYNTNKTRTKSKLKPKLKFIKVSKVYTLLQLL